MRVELPDSALAPAPWLTAEDIMSLQVTAHCGKHLLPEAMNQFNHWRRA